MNFLYVAIVFMIMTLPHNYKSINQTLEGFGAVMKGLLKGGFIDDPDCGEDENPIEEYFGFLFPNLMCEYIGIADSLSRTTLAFMCCGGITYLVVSFNSMYDQICTEVNVNYEKDLEVDLLDEDEFDDLSLVYSETTFTCNHIFVMMRCLCGLTTYWTVLRE